MIRTLMIIGLLAAGGTQAAAQSLVGKWDCSGREGRGTAIRTLQEYRANGQFYHLANLAMGDRNGRLDAAVALRGTWKMEGDWLVENVKVARMRSLGANGQDITNTAIGKQMAKTMPKRMAGPTKVSRTKIKMVSPTQLRMVSGRIRGGCTKR